MTTEIKIKALPSVDPSVCSFKIEELFVGRMIHCTSLDEAHDPLVKELMALEGVAELLVNDKLITVSKGESPRSWSELGGEIAQTVRSAMALGKDLFLEEAPAEEEHGCGGGGHSCGHCSCDGEHGHSHGHHDHHACAMDDNTLFQAVHEILEQEVNPQLSSHGGKIQLIRVENGQLFVTMEGGCQGCSMAQQTLRQGVERHLKMLLPAIQGITDMTHHESGSTPYYK